ncbi:hypothetical protein ABTZ99_13445 [Actinosynnema sp. NPDC002837]
MSGQRAPLPGEKCSCGGDPVVVYIAEDGHPVPYCGVPGGTGPNGGVR